VKEIFKKSSFCNEILYDEWYSQNITAVQEEDCQHYEAAAAALDFMDMSAEQVLHFDLTNKRSTARHPHEMFCLHVETLLAIETCGAPCPQRIVV
jgi:hypothetical protein